MQRNFKLGLIFILSLVLLVNVVFATEEVELANAFANPTTTGSSIRFTPNQSVYITNISTFTSGVTTQQNIDRNSGAWVEIINPDTLEIYYTSIGRAFGRYKEPTFGSYDNYKMIWSFDEVFLNQSQTYILVMQNSTVTNGFRRGTNSPTTNGWNVSSTYLSGTDIWVYFWGFFPLPPLTIDLVNNSLNYINETFTVSYDSVGSDGLFDCDLYLDDVLNQSDTSLNLSDTQDFVMTFGAVEESHTLEISCSGSENKTTGVINFAVDGIQPRAIINTPDDEVEFTYLVGEQDLDVDVDFQNVNLQDTNVTIKNSTNDIVYNEYDNLTGLNLTEYNVAFTIDINTLPVGEYTIEFYARDQLYERLKVQTFTISLCPEVWVAEYSSCNISDEQILSYTDSNSCGTTNDLPVDDNSVVECNYCTSTYEQTSGSECVAGQSTRDITYDYTNTCCETTGLETDCNIPANTTESCIGLHSTDDITGLVIDGGVELGREYIKFAPLVALIGLAIWGIAII